MAADSVASIRSVLPLTSTVVLRVLNTESQTHTHTGPIEIGEPGVMAELDEPGMGEGIREHAQLPDIIDHGRWSHIDCC